MGLSAFLDELCDELRALEPETQASLAAAADHDVEVVTAAPLTKDEVRHVRDALKKAFGAEPQLAFRADPALIAGIELRSRHTIVRNSWRADLDRIREELSRDGHARGA